jgi:hypothetical protein
VAYEFARKHLMMDWEQMQRLSKSFHAFKPLDRQHPVYILVCKIGDGCVDQQLVLLHLIINFSSQLKGGVQ